jgi:hypothetical protein
MAPVTDKIFKKDKKPLLIYVVQFILTAGFILLGIRVILFLSLPVTRVDISYLGSEEKLIIPPRPGIKGIVITGPQVQPLFFSVDLSRAGVRSLDFQQLELMDPHTDIKVNCTIDPQGRLMFSQKDILMEGHTEAGMMIQRALKTWVYTPYKMGRIKFWFNLPSKGRKVIIDLKGLKRKDSIPKHIPIYTGQVHMIDGVAIHEIQVGGQI